MRAAPLSVLLTSLPLEFPEAVRAAAALGFAAVDVIALADRPAEHREALAESGLLVACASLGRSLPEGQALDAVDPVQRLAALAAVKRQMTDAAQLGATHGYVVPGTDASANGLSRFGQSCQELADYAAQRMIRLCVEHVPGRALPTARAVAAWLKRHPHPNLELLLDVGHCLITREDPAEVLSVAPVGYLHLDDNDGQHDLHWPLLTGHLTEEMLARTLVAWQARVPRQQAGLALELHPSPLDSRPEGQDGAGSSALKALHQGKALVERLLTGERKV